MIANREHFLLYLAFIEFSSGCVKTIKAEHLKNAKSHQPTTSFSFKSTTCNSNSYPFLLSSLSLHLSLPNATVATMTSLANNVAVSCLLTWFDLNALVLIFSDSPVTKIIGVKAQECFQKCQFERSGDSDCQRDCAKDYLPENGRGFAQGTPYGNNPQGGYNGQNYGQPYGKPSSKKKKTRPFNHAFD
jgi:hypothetical protein